MTKFGCEFVLVELEFHLVIHIIKDNKNVNESY